MMNEEKTDTRPVYEERTGIRPVYARLDEIDDGTLYHLGTKVSIRNDIVRGGQEGAEFHVSALGGLIAELSYLKEKYDSLVASVNPCPICGQKPDIGIRGGEHRERPFGLIITCPQCGLSMRGPECRIGRWNGLRSVPESEEEALPEGGRLE